MNKENKHYQQISQNFSQNLPEDHKPFTDKYFLRVKEILQAIDYNPFVSLKVFTRGNGNLAGLEAAVNVLTHYSDIEKTGEVWIKEGHEFESKESLMIIKAPAQSIVELETMYLGVLSHALSQANGYPLPNQQEIKQKVERLSEIYQDKNLLYFGARHYHFSLDKMIAQAALAGGASQTSTDSGSSNIGLKGVGTTPHFLTIALAAKYGKENATLKTAQLFDTYIDKNVPRVTLVDTFNHELSDSCAVANYFGKRKNAFRIDTCGENIGEGGSLYNEEKARDPSYQTGTGVTIELAENLRSNLINHGFGKYTETILSSGFGDEKKAEAFMKADAEFKAKTGYNLFTGVGVGEVSKALFCTSDIFEVNNKPFSKTGREVHNVNYDTLERVI